MNKPNIETNGLALAIAYIDENEPELAKEMIYMFIEYMRAAENAGVTWLQFKEKYKMKMEAREAVLRG